MEIIAEFKECPDCKVDARLMNFIVQKEIEKGNIGKDLMPNTQAKIFTNIDARKPPLAGGRVPSGRVYYDICMKCGREYIWRIEKGHMTIPARPGQIPVFA